MIRLDGALSNWKNGFGAIPWGDVAMSFIVPKTVFYLSMNRPWQSQGTAFAILWCAALFGISRAVRHRTDIFALLALVTILIQLVPVMIKEDPYLNFFAGALVTAVYAAIFLGSVAVGRPLIKIIAESFGAKEIVPVRVLESVHYGRAWNIVTSVWGLVYMIEAVLLYVLSVQRSPWAILLDIGSSWPTTLTLAVFSVKFTKRYWHFAVKEEVIGI